MTTTMLVLCIVGYLFIGAIIGGVYMWQNDLGFFNEITKSERNGAIFGILWPLFLICVSWTFLCKLMGHIINALEDVWLGRTK